MLDTAKINFAAPEIKANPHPLYARLRDEARVARVRLWGVGGWMLTRYDDVVAAMKDERLASDRRNAPTGHRPFTEKVLNRMTGPLNRSMLASDEPDHGRLRGLVHQAFTARRVEQMRDRIGALTEELLNKVAARREMDIVRDLALPLPSTIIAEMLGLPAADRERFHHWSDAMLTLSSMNVLAIAGVAPTVLAFRRYIREQVRLRRRRPSDDLISGLLEAEESGQKLSEDEILAMIFLLLIAGHETTVNLIGNGMLALMEHPAERERLRAAPGLMPSAIEELLRYESPLELANPRWTRCAVTLAGATIPAGEPVIMNLVAANRDPRQFERPDVLELARNPNRHVAFGAGSHYCLGAFLARLEAQIVFTTLLERFPELRLAVPRDRLRWRNSFVLRGLESLPVTWRQPAAAAT